MAKWHTHENGYHRELWLLDAADMVIGSVRGTPYNENGWYAFKETTDGTKRIGKFLNEKAAKRAVELATEEAMPMK